MKTLETNFRLNGLLYTLIKRNDKAALYSISGEFIDKILHWEVDVIYIRKDKFREREHIADNDTFGRDRSRCFNNEAESLKYFESLTEVLRKERNQSQGVPKSIAEVDQNTKVIAEHIIA
jgi:hypothetical protein